MESIHVTQRLRPTSYGFLVKPDDPVGVLRAVGFNTVLWGGIHNPIVPTGTGESVAGILRTFDPDYIVNLTGNDLDAEVADGYRGRVLRETDIVRVDNSRNASLRIGFNILPLLRHTYEKEIRFLPRESRAAVISTSSPEPWPTYVAFQFGAFEYLPELGGQFKDAFKDALKARPLSFTPAQGSSELADIVSPIQFTAHGLRKYGGSASFSSHIVYVGDASSLGDLIEYWNIRASGRDVWFVPTEQYKAHQQAIEKLLREGHYAINPHVRNHADLQRGPSVAEQQFNEISEWISSLTKEPVSRRTWSPRFGVEIDRYVGDIHAAELEVASADEISILKDGRLTPVKPVSPSVLDDIEALKGDYHWSIELTFIGAYGHNEWMLNLPRTPGIDRLLRRAFPGRPGEVRVGKRALTVTRDHARRSLFLAPLRTQDVFNSLFEHAGFSVGQSLPGRHTQKLIEKMGSLQFDCRVFKIRGVRDIIHRLSNGSILTKGNMFSIVNSTDPDIHGQNWRPDLYEGLYLESTQEKHVPSFTEIFRVLQDKRIVRPGMTFRCPNCFAEDWYHVSEFDEEYTCRFCFNRQRVDFTSKHEWQYKADGLLQIKDGAWGSLAVIVSLWRLSELSSREGKYSSSIKLQRRNGPWECELDYAYIISDFLRTSYDLAFGQATGFTDFTDVEIQKMRDLADAFQKKPYLVFSTLKESFSESERQLFRQMSADGYLVIVFTRLELDPYHLYQRFENAPQKYAVSLADLSHNTIAVNLT